MFITLKPHGQRSATADQVIARLNRALQPVQGITLYMQAAQDINPDHDHLRWRTEGGIWRSRAVFWIADTASPIVLFGARLKLSVTDGNWP